ncbi:MAG: signal peptide peptidase SppA [Bacteroidales bacterium]|nr:signal peptide peptidase SppA [Bacteroidales bacterium]MBP3254786.1 signal peptide peptidase SppA [Bacteroidales bacterium]
MKQFFKFLFASCLGSGLAMILSFFIILGVITSMIASVGKNSDDVKVKDNSVLVVDLSNPVYDREIEDIQSMLSTDGINNKAIGLTEFMQVIEKAKNDKNIKAIMLNIGMFQANGVATAQEVREILQDFKTNGKKIYAYGDMVDQKSYYIATVADKIMVNPAGMVTLSGLGGEVMYYKDLIAKLDIDVDLIRPVNNAYKSAGETYTMNHMSDSNRIQTRQYLNSIWSVLSSQMSKARGIDEQRFNDLIASLQGFLPQDAYNNKLIDYLGFKSDYKDTINKDVIAKNKLSAKTKINYISYDKYRKSITDINKPQSENIAIVYAYGNVNQGKGGDLSIGSETVCKAIERAADNDKVKAIVLRVNSPGGDAVASELITNEVIKAKKKKPVIVSMGDMAASAGYEMSSNASYIVANQTTITGSIGVFGVIPNFGRALKNKIGITFDTVKTHANSNPMSIFTPMTKEAKAMMQRNVENFYTNFIAKVAQGRGKTPEYINTIAKGRVWSGADAKPIGLVDEFGGLKKAIQVAANKANLKSYGIVTYPKTMGILDQIMSTTSEETKMKSLTKELGKPYSFFLQLKDISEMQGVQMRMDYIINF